MTGGGKFKSISYLSEIEDADNSSDLSGGGGSPSLAADHKLVTTSSPKKSRKALQKKVLSIPIKDLDSSRSKGESAPPSDSWAWRKYGQKPIKGSPYPRGYYRCSSSKGCPARKQVERSRVDPAMLVVTYSSDHNHPWPPSSRNHHHNASRAASTSPSTASTSPGTASTSRSTASTSPRAVAKTETLGHNPAEKEENKFTSLAVPITEEFHGWFGDMAMLDSPMLAETSNAGDADVAMMFRPIMGEEEESLFADLGELPECSVVFRRREVVGAAAAAAQWCGTTS